MEITDIRIPFWRLVMILVKWTIAAIPAAIIVAVLIAAVTFVIAAVFGLAIGPSHAPRPGFY